MSKRTNEGHHEVGHDTGEGEQKRRKINFEPVRMQAVSNVSDIRGRALVVQATKLKQQLMYKNKVIDELEREASKTRDKLMAAQAKSVKAYSLFAEAHKYINCQARLEFGDSVPATSVPPSFVALDMHPDNYDKFIEEMKTNLRHAFGSFSAARKDRAHEMSVFMDKMGHLVLETEKSTEYNKELSVKANQIALENERLHGDVTQAQADYYNADRKKRQNTEMLQLKVEQLEQQLADAKWLADKQMQLANKHEFRLANIAYEHQQTLLNLQASGASMASIAPGPITQQRDATSPGTPPSESAAKELDALRQERDDAQELASRRLAEIEEMSRQMQELKHENGRLKFEAMHLISPDEIPNSEEYKTLKRYYSLSIKEYERVCKELDEMAVERDKLRNVSDQRFYQMSEEQMRTTKEIEAQAKIHNEFYHIAHDCEVLRAEHDAVAMEYNKTVKQCEWNEMKATLMTMRALNAMHKLDAGRSKEKHRHARQEIAQLKDEIRALKERQEKCVMVPLVETSRDFDGDFNKLRAEYEALKKEIRRLGSLEKRDRQQQWEEVQKEIATRMKEIQVENETLRRANEILTNDEQIISDELEQAGTAVEEELERNSQLVIEKREQEDRNLKLMNDRIVQNQVQQKLKEKLECYESKASMDAQISKMLEFEKKGLQEAISKCSETMQFKSAECTRAMAYAEQNRKLATDLGSIKEEYIIKCDRLEIQARQTQEAYVTKLREAEENRLKRQRVEEELETLRQKYERAKRSESTGGGPIGAGGGDQVLEEANRQMKETLTCPSCKTRPKDCIMLKCYHLFCEPCIKTMYDTRQRKCPKCASNFGANDFHRVFI
ncbi:unnamed protein product [Caenorhabditis sp. 36 PRJEB53466]|nr:unnamed protein product [Caenorhabditis sp. 36 PRJEB53466]